MDSVTGIAPIKRFVELKLKSNDVMKRIILLILSFLAICVQAQQWVVSHPAGEGVVLVGGDCNGNGNYIVGACNNNGSSSYYDAYAMYVENNGDFIEKSLSFDGYKSHLCSAICLDDGNAFVVGVKGGTLTNHIYDTLWILVMTPELEIVEEHDYPIVEPYLTWTTDVYLEFNNEGDIIVLADVSEYDYPWMTNGVYAVFKCDVHGNMLQSKYFAEGHGMNGARPTGLIRVPNSDYMMMLGKGFFVTNSHSICYIDNELEKVDAFPLPWLEDVWNYTDCWKENGHFLMSSMSHHYGVVENSFYAAVFEVDDRGNYVDTLVYDRADTSDYTAQFGSMAYVSDEIIYIATYWESGQNEQPSDAVICLIDSDLNLKGTKRLKAEDIKIRIMHCQRTSDGGCLVYGQCKKSYDTEMLYVWKLLPEDFVIPWTLNENPEVLPHHEVYPNPTKDCLNLVLDNDDDQRYRVSVTDMRGRKYFEHRFDNVGGLLRLDVSSLENGAYFYEIFDGRSIQKGKFLKY